MSQVSFDLGRLPTVVPWALHWEDWRTCLSVCSVIVFWLDWETTGTRLTKSPFSCTYMHPSAGTVSWTDKTHLLLKWERASWLHITNLCLLPFSVHCICAQCYRYSFHLRYCRHRHSTESPVAVEEDIIGIVKDTNEQNEVSHMNSLMTHCGACFPFFISFSGAQEKS